MKDIKYIVTFKKDHREDIPPFRAEEFETLVEAEEASDRWNAIHEHPANAVIYSVTKVKKYAAADKTKTRKLRIPK